MTVPPTVITTDGLWIPFRDGALRKKKQESRKMKDQNWYIFITRKGEVEPYPYEVGSRQRMKLIQKSISKGLEVAGWRRQLPAGLDNFVHEDPISGQRVCISLISEKEVFSRE
jgi:hypothetical protein